MKKKLWIIGVLAGCLFFSGCGKTVREAKPMDDAKRELETSTRDDTHADWADGSLEYAEDTFTMFLPDMGTYDTPVYDGYLGCYWCETYETYVDNDGTIRLRDESGFITKEGDGTYRLSLDGGGNFLREMVERGFMSSDDSASVGVHDGFLTVSGDRMGDTVCDVTLQDDGSILIDDGSSNRTEDTAYMNLSDEDLQNVLATSRMVFEKWKQNARLSGNEVSE